MELIITTEQELRKIIYSSVELAVKEQFNKTSENKIYSINQVAKMLNKKHETIKRLILTGVIKGTADGKISQQNLNEYMKNNN